jgi:hypothetical protein
MVRGDKFNYISECMIAGMNYSTISFYWKIIPQRGISNGHNMK